MNLRHRLDVALLQGSTLWWALMRVHHTPWPTPHSVNLHWPWVPIPSQLADVMGLVRRWICQEKMFSTVLWVTGFISVHRESLRKWYTSWFPRKYLKGFKEFFSVGFRAAEIVTCRPFCSTQCALVSHFQLCVGHSAGDRLLYDQQLECF